MKLLFVSTHTDQITGYGRVAYHLLSAIKDVSDLDVFHYGFQRHPEFRRPRLHGVVQIDAADIEDPKEQGFGFNAFKATLDTVKPDLILVYNDTIIVNRFLDLIPEGPRVWVYLDQVYKGTALGKIAERAERVIVFSKEWMFPVEAGLKQQCVLHHGASSTVVDSRERREALGLTGKTVFLNVNRNSTRKRLDLTLMAFARFQKKNPLAHLILVSGSQGTYDFNIIAQIEQMDPTSITWLDTSKTHLTDEDINMLMNIADYGINTADGEGFGLTTLDHANLGKPQVVMDIGAYRSFLTDCDAVFVKPTVRQYIQNQGVGLFTESADADTVAAAMEKVLTLLPPAPKPGWDAIGATLRGWLAEAISPVLTERCLSTPSSSKTEAITSEGLLISHAE